VYSKCGFKAKFKGRFVSVKLVLNRNIITILSRTSHTRKRYKTVSESSRKSENLVLTFGI